MAIGLNNAPIEHQRAHRRRVMNKSTSVGAIRVTFSKNEKKHKSRASMSRSVSLARVVVTGIGAHTPLGPSAAAAWDALLANKHGMCEYDGDAHGVPVHVVARAPALNVRSDLSSFIEFALAASKQVFDDAAWQPEPECGVAIGSGMGGLPELLDAHQTFLERGYRRLSPFFVPKILSNMAAGNVSIAHSLHGPNHSVATACATGAHAIGDAYRLIALGHAPAMLCGASEASITPLALAGFARAKALSPSREPGAASRPFDAARDGFVMGEGAALMLLESLDHARARNARIYAELVGYGMSGDAHHITQSSGNGAIAAMRAALRDARVEADCVDYINAHATSTPLGDENEARAIDAVFAHRPLVSSSKGATGHLLGAAGALEAIFTVLALHHAVAPHTRNLEHSNAPLRHVHAPTAAPLRYAMTNSFGFGGTNAVLLFKRYEPQL
jgi:3-oxoacyl-[acyl-carrier-protein] synthase II